jgi:hypothetical protein
MEDLKRSCHSVIGLTKAQKHKNILPSMTHKHLLQFSFLNYKIMP